jgi:hypothetical protein
MHVAKANARVFISYSRKDILFADRLEAALKARGIEPLIDRAEVHAFEDWWKRIEGLIAQADTVVFVLSPDAVASQVALREVAFAGSLNKRFAPVVCRMVDPQTVPEALAKLNFIVFGVQSRRPADHHGAEIRVAPDPTKIRVERTLGACPFNRFGRTGGEYDSAKYPILSLGFYVNPPDWHAGEFHSPRLGDLRLLGQAPRVSGTAAFSIVRMAAGRDRRDRAPIRAGRIACGPGPRTPARRARARALARKAYKSIRERCQD